MKIRHYYVLAALLIHQHGPLTAQDKNDSPKPRMKVVDGFLTANMQSLSFSREGVRNYIELMNEGDQPIYISKFKFSRKDSPFIVETSPGILKPQSSKTFCVMFNTDRSETLHDTLTIYSNTKKTIRIALTYERESAENVFLISNPVSSKIILFDKPSPRAQVIIRSGDGNILYANQFSSEIDWSNNSPGIYYITLLDNGVSKTMKFMKK